MKISEAIKKIVRKDQAKAKEAHARLSGLSMPPWALGRMMELAEDLVGMTSKMRPDLKRKINVVMAGDHGVAEEGVSAYPQEVTQYMVSTILKGGAAINAIAKQVHSEVVVVDMGVSGSDSSWKGFENFYDKKIADGSRNMTQGPAMSLAQAKQSVEVGFELAIELGKSSDVFGLGEMGIANTTSATAILCAIEGVAAKEVTGRGTGLDEASVLKKIAVIEKALQVNQPLANNGLDILHKVGGYEIGGMTGFILGAASLKKPIVIDGLISTSAALIAQSLSSESMDYVIASHQSVEPGHIRMLKKLGKEAYLNFNMRLGEGTGAALFMPFLDSSVGILNDTMTLDEVLAGD